MENNSIAWLNFPDGLHTYGIQILSNNPVMIYDFKRSLINYCNRFNCKYFIQGEDLANVGRVSWLFIEFFGEANQDKILGVVNQFSKYWYDDLYNHEVLWTNHPTRDILIALNLL